MKKKKLFYTLLVALMCTSCATPNFTQYAMSDFYNLPKPGVGGYQGIAIYKDYLVSLQNGGVATNYRLPDMQVVTPTFKLASAHSRNHSNVGAFGVERGHKDDLLPVLYVSQCHRKLIRGMKDACFVERLLPEGKSELLQTIILDDDQKLFGYALQWTVDSKNKRLIGFGNTLKGEDANNRFRVIVFPLPKLADGKEIHLRPEDAIENYLLQDYTQAYPARIIGQGACVYGDRLVMPTGFGNKEWPSVLYVWDMKHKRMERVVDLSTELKAEMEDVDFYKGEAYVQTNGRGIVKFKFGKRAAAGSAR